MSLRRVLYKVAEAWDWGMKQGEDKVVVIAITKTELEEIVDYLLTDTNLDKGRPDERVLDDGTADRSGSVTPI